MGSGNDTTRAVRAVRCAPAVRSAAAAVSVGVTNKAMRKHLGRLRVRGRCGAVIASALDGAKGKQLAMLLSDKRCPPAVARLAAQHNKRRVRDAAAGTAAWSGRSADTSRSPRAACAATAVGDDSWAARDAARGAGCPVAMLVGIIGRGRPQETRGAADNPNCGPGLIQMMAQHPDVDLRSAVASNQQLPAGLLDRLAADQSPTVRRSVASRKRSPPNVWEILSADDDWEVRSEAAERCPVTLLAGLASDDDPSVREAVAGRRKCPPEVLARLAYDYETQVLSAVAGNPGCSAEQLRDLAEEHDSDVREGVASNPSCPPDLLAALAEHDPEPAVRETAAIMMD